MCHVNYFARLQSAKEYYEQAVMLELKKNQELQEYIRLLESRLHHSEIDCTPAKQVLYLPLGLVILSDFTSFFMKLLSSVLFIALSCVFL